MATTKKETAPEKKARLAAEKLAEENQALEQRLADAERIRAQEAEDMAAQLEEAQRQIAELQTPQVPEVEIIAPAVKQDVPEVTRADVGAAVREHIAAWKKEAFDTLDKKLEEKLPHVRNDLKKVAGFPQWAKIATGVVVALALFAIVRPYFQNRTIAKEYVTQRQLKSADSARASEMDWIEYKIDQQTRLLMDIEGRDDTAAIERVKLYRNRLLEIEKNKTQKNAIIKDITDPGIDAVDKLNRFTRLVFSNDTSARKNN